MIRYPLSFFAVLLVGLPVVQACPRAVCHAPVKEIVLVPTAPLFVPVAVPLYGVSFQPGYQLPPPVVAAPRVPAAAGAPAVAPSAAALPPSPATAPGEEAAPAVKAPMLQTLCASCHSREMAASKGKGLVVVQDGLRAALTAQQTKAALKQVWQGAMPKGNKPSDEQVSQAIDEIIQ